MSTQIFRNPFQKWTKTRMGDCCHLSLSFIFRSSSPSSSFSRTVSQDWSRPVHCSLQTVPAPSRLLKILLGRQLDNTELPRARFFSSFSPRADYLCSTATEQTPSQRRRFSNKEKFCNMPIKFIWIDF